MKQESCTARATVSALLCCSGANSAALVNQSTIRHIHPCPICLVENAALARLALPLNRHVFEMRGCDLETGGQVCVSVAQKLAHARQSHVSHLL